VVFAFPAGRYRRWQLNGQAVTPRREGNVAVVEADGKAITLAVAP
jgi:hypothetical protein